MTLAERIGLASAWGFGFWRSTLKGLATRAALRATPAGSAGGLTRLSFADRDLAFQDRKVLAANGAGFCFFRSTPMRPATRAALRATPARSAGSPTRLSLADRDLVFQDHHHLAANGAPAPFAGASSGFDQTQIENQRQAERRVRLLHSGSINLTARDPSSSRPTPRDGIANEVETEQRRIYSLRSGSFNLTEREPSSSRPTPRDGIANGAAAPFAGRCSSILAGQITISQGEECETTGEPGGRRSQVARVATGSQPTQPGSRQDARVAATYQVAH